MQLLSLNFSLYTACGIWLPVESLSIRAKLLYHAFTFYVMFSMYTLLLGELLDLVFAKDDLDAFTINSLKFVTLFVVGCKAPIVIIRRNMIIDLVKTLSREPCKPQDAEEIAIQAKFDKFIRTFTIIYCVMAMGSWTSIHTKSVLDMINYGITPHKVWVPYNLNSTMPFLITSIQQMVTYFFCTFINIGTDTVVLGMFLQTCSQLEIFEKRLRKFIISETSGLVDENRESGTDVTASHKTIYGHIRHHLIIYEYAKTVNHVFNQILFAQFFISLYILCMSVFYLSSHVAESEAAFMVIYTTCMFLQIYIYCWSGNEVMLKSAGTGEALYQTEWPLLSISKKKVVLMIMKRSTIPIKFTSSFLITLSLESYSNILKTSYTAFNVLQQRS